jgi:hypothetical protein
MHTSRRRRPAEQQQQEQPALTALDVAEKALEILRNRVLEGLLFFAGAPIGALLVHGSYYGAFFGDALLPLLCDTTTHFP